MTATEKPEVIDARLAFDEAAHTYRLDGLVVPSVTQVLRHVLPGWQASSFYLQRGRALHHGCRLLDEGRLDWSSVSAEIEPRMRAWQKFREDWKAPVVSVELQMADAVYGFAGTCDRVFDEEGTVIADLKSTIERQVIPQLGGYSLLHKRNGETPQRAVAIELRDDGTYRTLWIDKHQLRRAEQTFLAALSVYNFLAENNLLRNKP